MSSDEYYDANTMAIYMNYCETLGELYDGLSEEKFNEIILAALKDSGIGVLEQSKLEKSTEYYLTKADEDIYSMPGYRCEVPDFDKYLG